LRGKATIRSRSLKMSPSPRTPSTPGARFPEANARINYEPCSNRRTEERRAVGANGAAERGGHPYYGRSRDEAPPVSMSLCYSPSSLPSSTVPRFFISASRLCLTSVAKFFRPATIIAPRRSQRWRRKTGIRFAASLPLDSVEMYARVRTRNQMRGPSENRTFGERGSSRRRVSGNSLHTSLFSEK